MVPAWEHARRKARACIRIKNLERDAAMVRGRLDELEREDEEDWQDVKEQDDVEDQEDEEDWEDVKHQVDMEDMEELEEMVGGTQRIFTSEEKEEQAKRREERYELRVQRREQARERLQSAQVQHSNRNAGVKKTEECLADGWVGAGDWLKLSNVI